MTANKRILLGALGALAVLAWLALGRAPSTDSIPSTAPPGSRAASRATLESLEGRLSAGRLAALERRIEELEEQLPVEGQAPRAAHGADQDPPDDVAPELDPAEAAALDERKMVFRENALRSEPVDPAWSRETENQIAHAFQEAAFGGSSLQRTQCGSSFCVLVVRHDDEAARVDFERFTSALPGMGGELVFRRSADGRSETTGFFIRPGKDGPDHPVRRF